MKKLLIVAALALMPTPAVANDISWSPPVLNDDATSRWSMDYGSYETHGSIASFVVRQEESDTGRYTIMYLDIDCASARYRIGPWFTLVGSREVDNSATWSSWAFLADGTIGEYFADSVCEWR